MRIAAALTSACLALVLAACSQSADEVEYLEASEAYITIPAGGRDVAGGGLVFKAEGEAYVIKSASAPVAERVEIHTMAMVDGVMQMRPVDALEVTPGETKTLGPGGDHLMFFGVAGKLTEGETIELYIEAEGSESGPVTLNIEADVRTLGAD